ncbi:uncharacterized protein ATNIH1004_000005 [Aspergillus tanneri]|uniref:Uncharacterized protein n=1 Tax=Aspergillus tanneri TaxID=1220188 RepID=A0A5M9N961_9EURO|nr:uncharacterized protein ATNIH1004_000005 [Aspergillus tanneri]KAA8651127.1 hypothetical protein ATNIH1004_000005 [Aspergillus tanneri]
MAVIFGCWPKRPRQTLAGCRAIQVCNLSGQERYGTIRNLVITSFNRVLNRALDSLASTHPPIRRLFRSSSQTGLSAVELDRQQPKTLQRYRRVWRRYLAWMVRGAPLTDQERTEILGLRLDKYKQEHLTRIWDTLQAYLAHPEETLAAGHFLQRMEQTNTRQQAVKRAYNRNYIIYHHCQLPGGYRRRAQTAAARERDPDTIATTNAPWPSPYSLPSSIVNSDEGLRHSTPRSSCRRQCVYCVYPYNSTLVISRRSILSNQSDEEEEDFLTSTESPIPSMGNGANLDQTSRRGVPQLPPEYQRWLDKMVFSLCISSISTRAIQQTGNKFDSSLVVLTAVLAIYPVHLTVAGPYSYTSDLAAILWISRLLLLEYALPAKPYHFINNVPVPAAVHYTFGVRHTFYPLEEILRLTAYGIYQMYHEIQHLIHTTTDFFNRELLLGYVEDFTLADLVDVPSERQSGFSFLDMAPTMRGPRASLSSCSASIHCLVTWGQTSREKELLTIKWQNTATSQRNIFLSNGQVIIITEYYKTRRRTVRTHPVARFLPSALVPPESRARREAKHDYYFFVIPSLPVSLPPRKLTHLLRQSTQPFFNSAYLTTLSYRHLSIAIAKKHLRPQITGSNLQSAETVLHNILAAQAGHHSHINN